MPDFGFTVGDTIYVAYPKRNKVCRLKTDCIKIFKDNVTVHGYVEKLYATSATPTEVSLKYLNQKFVFLKKKDAINWLAQKNKTQATAKRGQRE